MKLNLKELENRKNWEESGFILPEFDIAAVRRKTGEKPCWIHFGAGNIFRAFPAVICQRLLNKRLTDRGIIVAEGYDTEIIDKIFKPYDNLSLCVTLNSDGSIKKQVIASVTEALKADFSDKADTERLKKIFASDSLEMASFTITPNGYRLKGADGSFTEQTRSDFINPPDEAKTFIGRLAALCLHRFQTSGRPLSLVSMDNFHHNGSALEDAVTTFAKKWAENGIVPETFYDYTRTSLSYPWTMIDKGTPGPSDTVGGMLRECVFENTETLVTQKHTFAAPFVNSEAPQYLIIEDNFKNGRPPLDKGGVIFTDRKTVDKAEKMKDCTCFDPLHTALAVFGCLLGYDRISEEMKDKDIVALIKHIGYDEGLPVVTDPVIIDPREFIDEAINVRLPNNFMPYTPQLIICNTSQKVGKRFGETIKAHEGNAAGLIYIPLALAGWCRYLMAKDDKGDDFELAPDPMLKELTGIISKIHYGINNNVHAVLSELLSRKEIFGVDLYTAGLGEKIEGFFTELNSGAGSVRRTVEKYCRNSNKIDPLEKNADRVLSLI